MNLTSKIFNDKLYILFTDYTGKEQRKVAKERREKDPILFGALELISYFQLNYIIYVFIFIVYKEKFTLTK